jgi:ABC-2 type transport system permease protein
MRFLVRVGAMASKEVMHIRRDPRTLYMALAMPVVMLLIFGFGVSFDMDRIPLVVLDGDRSVASRALVRAVSAGHEFVIAADSDEATALRMIRRGQALAALAIPADYQRDLAAGRDGEVQLIVDGADGVVANQILAKIDGLVRAESLRRIDLAAEPPLQVKVFTLFNPEARSALFMVPGLAVYLLAIAAVLLTALTVSGEWERGSMEQLFASPVGRLEIVLGKLLPYLGLGMLQLLLVVAVGAVIFDVPIRGSVALLFFVGFLFLAGMLGQGLFISVVARSQLVAVVVAVGNAGAHREHAAHLAGPVIGYPGTLFRARHARNHAQRQWFVDSLDRSRRADDLCPGHSCPGHHALSAETRMITSPRWSVQLRAVVRKEIRQTVRDRRIMFMLIVAPLLQTVVFGFAVDFQFDHVPTLVVDHDASAQSREHIRRLLADGTLRDAGHTTELGAVQRKLQTGDAAAALVLPEGLARAFAAQRAAEVQVILDGGDPNRAVVVAGAASRYFGEAAESMVKERLAAHGIAPPPLIRATPRIWFNPSLKTPPYMIPGVMTILLVITTTLVTAMGLAREREMGTLEQVLVTPIRPLFLLVGKMTPFLVIGCFDVLLVLTAGVWIFGVPLHGSLALVATGTVLYVLCTLGIGLLISTVSRTQQQAFLAGFLFAMPAILLSGVMTPIRAMPFWLQVVTTFNPVRYYIEVLRAVLLKGAGLVDIWWRLLALLGFGLALLTVASLRFHKRVA